jgi:hypothetical protein
MRRCGTGTIPSSLSLSQWSIDTVDYFGLSKVLCCHCNESSLMFDPTLCLFVALSRKIQNARAYEL